MKNEQLELSNAPELQGVESSKAEHIRKVFEPMTKMLTAFEESYNEVVELAEKEITQEVTTQAKNLRIQISKIRTSAEKVRKDEKEEYLRAGKAIDGVNNILKWAIVEKENKLKDIENYFEIREQQRLVDLQYERMDLLQPFVGDDYVKDLSSMDEDVWNAYLSAKKKDYEDRIEAEKKAEADRIAKEKAEKEEQERIRKENEKLKKEAEERESRNKQLRPYIQFIRDYDKLLNLSELEYKKEFQDIKKGAEDHWEFERTEQIRKEEEEAKRLKSEQVAKQKSEAERKKQDELLAKERGEREKAQKELKAKAEAERKAQEEEENRKQLELKKGDADKVNDLISDLEALKTKYSFKSKENQKKYADTCILIDKVIDHIQK